MCVCVNISILYIYRYVCVYAQLSEHKCGELRGPQSRPLEKNVSGINTTSSSNMVGIHIYMYNTYIYYTYIYISIYTHTVSHTYVYMYGRMYVCMPNTSAESCADLRVCRSKKMFPESTQHVHSAVLRNVRALFIPTDTIKQHVLLYCLCIDEGHGVTFRPVPVRTPR